MYTIRVILYTPLFYTMCICRHSRDKGGTNAGEGELSLYKWFDTQEAGVWSLTGKLSQYYYYY